MLVGREGVLRRVTALLDEARRGRSATLVLVGDAGLGKTALLEEAVRLAGDMRILAATGVESELELPFASLHELFRPVLDRLPRLPGPQAHALGAALALEQGEPDALAVGAGALSLLVELADEAPTLVVLDDAHWLDRASADALTFAARRLIGEQLAFLVASRPGLPTPFEPFPRVELEPLGIEDARKLLTRRSEPVAAADEQRLVAAAAGNPLVLLELPVELAGELPASATPRERLTRAFSSRVEELSAPARLGLLLAAAEPDAAAVRRVAERLQLELTDPLAEAEAAGLVRFAGDQVAFRHPVVRSLVYSGATAAERRAVHQALAEALSERAERDRRAWHLAAAAEGVDEQVAAALEETAERAASRGGHAAGAHALERAARLSPDRAEAARRLYEASRAAFWAGEAAHARELAEEALPLADDPLLHADLIQQLGGIGDWQGAQPAGERLPQGARADRGARRRAGGPDALRRDHAQPQVLRRGRRRRAGAAARGRRPRGRPVVAAPHALRRGRRLPGRGRARAAMELFRELADHYAMPAGFAFDYLALEWYDVLRASLDETLREGRAKGNRLRIVWNQSCAAHLELRLGRLDAAVAAAAEAIQLGEVIDTPALVGVASAALAGCRPGAAGGRVHRERAGGAGRAVSGWATASRRCRPSGAGAARARRGSAGGRDRAAGAGRADLGGEHGRRAQRGRLRPDLIEAHAAAGARRRGGGLAGALRGIADGRRPPLGPGGVGALRGDPRSGRLVRRAFTRAIDLLEGWPLPLELARTRLAYGERLRRQGRRRDARVQLRSGHDSFRSRRDPLAGARGRRASRYRRAGRRPSAASRRPHSAGAEHLAPRRRGEDEQGDRRRHVPQPEDDRVPPREHVPEAGHPLAGGARAYRLVVRILLVSQMYPGPDDPDLGVFVAQLERALEDRGHVFDRAVIDTRSGGHARSLRLLRDARSAARRFRPDVVYAHFLVPAGLAGSLASRAPLVVTAHGQDVANVGTRAGIATATRYVVRRAAAVVAVSGWLRSELERKVPDARGKVEVVDCGVDLSRFRPEPAPDGPPSYLCIGSLTGRKNVVRLASAFERLGEGTLTFVGDGPLRPQLEGRPGIELAGHVPHDEIPARLCAARVVCGPSLVEPFGQALLEALAGGRPVVATNVGGPPEFDRPEAGVLVDPLDEDEILEGLRRAAELPRPNEAAVAAAREHDVRRQAEKIEAILQPAAARPAPAEGLGGGAARGAGVRAAARAGDVRLDRAQVVAEVHVALHDDGVDQPPEDRSERRGDDVDPEAGRRGADEGGAEAPRRVHGRARTG